MLTYKLDINVDLGEGFGMWKMADDEKIMKYVSSVNIACGFHAGDPHIMRKTVQLAKKYGVQVGAHPGLPDLIGFGRRRIDVKPEELADYVIYQVGALKAFVEAADMELQHVLIHGIACIMCWYEKPYATAYVNALLKLDPKKKLILYGSRGGPGPKYVLDDVAKEAGLRVCHYWVLDMDYYPDGTLVMTRIHEPVNVEDRVQRVINMVRKGVIRDVNGNEIPYKPQSILVHSDTPNVIELLKALRTELPKEGIEIAPLKEIL